jgi:hypothetical protein
MRNLALSVLVTFSLASVACAVRLQPSQQGEWSNFHNDKDKVSKDAKTPAEKQPEAK